MGRDERPYNVTGKAFALTAIGFVVPLLLGIFFFISAGSRLSRQTQATIMQHYATLPTSRQVEVVTASSNLPTKLQQLKDAYDQNLIDSEEYNRKRSEVLQEFK